MSDEKRPPVRRKPAEIAALAGSHAEAAVAALVAVMKSDEATPAARIAAANTLLQWSYGKAGGVSRETADQEKSEERSKQIIELSWKS